MKVLSLALVLGLALGTAGYADVAPATSDDLAKMNKELMQTIGQLKNTVNSLESRLTSVEGRTSGAPVAVSAAEGDGIAHVAGGDVKISGFVDVSGGWNFQNPATDEALKYLQRLEAIYPDRKLPCFDPSRVEYRQQPQAAELADRGMAATDWFEARGLLTLLLSPVLRTARMHQGVHARVSQQFLSVQQYLHTNMHRPLVLGDLARAAKLHPTYFSDRFRELVGVRPLEYLMQRRMERAQYLLITSVASVKEIAAQVGFDDAAYFTRAFTRVCGKSPSAYRTAHAS
jgi:AraC-like DNA-binding protein